MTALFVTIAKRFTFDAAHRLDMLPADHKCNRLHGHTYTVEVVLTGHVQTSGPHVGFLIDYQAIADAWAPVHDMLDHRYLNEVPGLEVPTTELLAAFIAGHMAYAFALSRSPDERLTLLERVTVHESSTTWCTVELMDMYCAGAPVPKPCAHEREFQFDGQKLERRRH